MNVTVDSLRNFIEAALEAAGIPQQQASQVATLMADADLNGSDGHGVFRLPAYVRRIRAGGINLNPTIKVVADSPSMALVDGDNGMGHLVMSFATELAIQKAKATGVAWVGARHSNHAGAASLYAKMPLKHDMLSMYFAVGNANHLPPWGGVDMLLSTNPIAVAIPAFEEPAIVLDMATTVAAYGKIKTKAQRGEQMPEGWMVDRQGRPLTDPKRSSEGFLVPIGGYKGYSLALVFGLLAGTLNGAAMGRDVIDFNKDDVSVTNTGHSILVIDPSKLGDTEAFKRRVDVIIRDIRNSERMDGVDRIWLPGEQSQMKRQARAKEGIPIPEALRSALRELAAELKISELR